MALTLGELSPEWQQALLQQMIEDLRQAGDFERWLRVATQPPLRGRLRINRDMTLPTTDSKE